MRKGDRVKLSEKAIRYGIYKNHRPNRLGTIIALTRDGDSAWVRWDGNKSTVAFCLGFLELLETAP